MVGSMGGHSDVGYWLTGEEAGDTKAVSLGDTHVREDFHPQTPCGLVSQSGTPRFSLCPQRPWHCGLSILLSPQNRWHFSTFGQLAKGGRTLPGHPFYPQACPPCLSYLPHHHSLSLSPPKATTGTALIRVPEGS